MSASEIAQVANLRFEYPGVRALDDVSFALERGTVTALVGPNGAGKSTLLRCMAGLETPIFGAIAVAGIDVLESPREIHDRHVRFGAPADARLDGDRQRDAARDLARHLDHRDGVA